MNFGNVLYNLRKREQISQKEIGDLVGVTSQAVGKWEAGTSEPDTETLKKIANYFMVSVDYLVGNETQNTDRNTDVKNIELLKNALRNSGFMKDKDDLTDEEFNTLMDFIKANEKFLFKDK